MALRVGAVADPAEAQADQMAQRVLARLGAGGSATDGPAAGGPQAPASAVRRVPAPGGGAFGAGGGALDSATQSRLAARQGRGAPLPGGVAGQMESAFGRSFSSVRLHTDAEARAISDRLSARAFTVGQDIYFGAGQYDPESAGGQHVLAHELAHTAQAGAGVRRLFGWGKKKQQAAAGTKTPEQLAKEAAETRAREKQETIAQSKRTQAAELAHNKDERAEGEKARKATSAALTGGVVDHEIAVTVGGQAHKQDVDAQGRTLKHSNGFFGDKVSVLGAPAEAAKQRGAARKQELIDQGASEADAAKRAHQETWLDRAPGRAADVNDRFEAVLAQEHQRAMFHLMVEGKPLEEAAELAYDETWPTLDKQQDGDLRSVRPPRETAAERLVAAVEQARKRFDAEDAVSEDIAKIFDKWAELFQDKVNRAKGAPSALPPSRNSAGRPAPPTAPRQRPPLGQAQAHTLDDQATTEARAACRGLDPLELAKFDNLDPPTRRRARNEALARLAAKNAPTVTAPAEKAETLGAKIRERTETYAGGVNSALGAGSTGAGLGGTAVGSVGTALSATGSDLHNAEAVPLVGPVVQAVDRMVHDKRTDTDFQDLVSGANDGVTPTHATAGADLGVANGIIGNTTDVVGTTVGIVSNTYRLVQAIREAKKHPSHQNRLAASKAALDTSQSLVSIGSTGIGIAQTALTAVNSCPGAQTALSIALPGVNIVAAVFSIASCAVQLAKHAMHMADTNNTLEEIRANTGKKDKTDVLLWPMWHLHRGWVKRVEQSTWDTTSALGDLAMGVLNTVSAAAGGLFGIPAMLTAAKSAINGLHTLGHMVADEVLVGLAKESKADSIGKLEGAGEERLRRDPAMAVDGIVVRARQGDQSAKNYLMTYGLTEDQIKFGKLDEVRKKVLDELGEDPDPKFLYEKAYEATIGNIKAGASNWKTAGELADRRNLVDDKGRGAGWRLKMMIRGGDRLKESALKTDAKTAEVLPGLELYTGADDAQVAAFVASGVQKVQAKSLKPELVSKVLARYQTSVVKTEQALAALAGPAAAHPDTPEQRKEHDKLVREALEKNKEGQTVKEVLDIYKENVNTKAKVPSHMNGEEISYLLQERQRRNRLVLNALRQLRDAIAPAAGGGGGGARGQTTADPNDPNSGGANSGAGGGQGGGGNSAAGGGPNP
ncbi:MAG: DUF4157 domain-containing protein [Actinomycetia bacterium]|nr:DUF4157 domain-containing protein [Actinomycetes bacterium]